MRRPNFFIVGAPKCGTTSLSEYLADHPQIFVSTLKEPHFFAADFYSFRPYYVQNEQEYFQLFADAQADHLAVGEASVWYLYSSIAAKKIYEFDPAVNIIVLLRNPVDLVYALHSQYYFSLVEDVSDFESAWRLQERRKDGLNVPRGVPVANHCLELLQYGRIGRLGEQMQNLLQVFPRHQVKAIFFEDLKETTSNVYKEVLHFLGVSDYGRTTFPTINANKTKKAHRVASALQTLKQVANRAGIKNTGLFQMMNEANTRQTAREPLSASFENELIEFFDEDIRLLANLLDRNLDHWLTPRSH
jgi:hypothetical protein